MHINAKKMAVSGILMAVTVLLVCFGGILESNTLFLLAGAAFCVGIIIKEYGLKTGVAFFIGSVILSLLFTPQKLHCITFALMGGYIVLIEAVFRILGMHPDWKQRKL